MTDETIQTDVSGAVADEQLAPEASPEAPLATDPVSKRERKYAEMQEKRKVQVDEERKAAALMDDVTLTEEVYDKRKAEADSPPADRARSGQEDNEPPGDDGVAAAPLAEATPQANQNGWSTNEDGTRIKTLMVNGEPKQITEEAYDRMAQKDMAGDAKLRMAAEIERNLAERTRLLDEKEQAITARQSEPPAQGAADDLKSVISEYQDALLDGDTDVAAEKMAQIVGMGRDSSTPNIDLIVSQATTQIKAEEQQERYTASINSGWEKFQAEYSDVLADPDAQAFADIQIKKLRESGEYDSPEAIILKAGEITRKRLGLSGGTAPAEGDEPAVDHRAERKARKANLKPIPRSGTTKHKVQEAPALDMSPEAKVARMRAARRLA